MGLPLKTGAARVLSVTEVTRLLRATLEEVVPELWVVGEISNFRAPASGHFYFSLKDATCQVAAVMFRGANQVLSFRPADGMEVVVHGRVSVYEVRGDLQLYVDWMEPRGVGGMQVALEQLKQRLAAEGLFAPERKRPLPLWPRAVGVVTALTGAAVHDVLAVLRARWPLARVVISPVRVQGKGAGADIAAAVAAINRVEGVEVIIVGRGGGSIEDLWAFNEEPVARAIAASGVPVVSAVGHEIDVTVADLVADCRAPTPTAAAALVVPDQAAVREQLRGLEGQLIASITRRVERSAERLRLLQQRLRDPRRSLQTMRQRLDELHERASRAVVQRLRWWRQRAVADGERLQALSPLAVLARGYSIARRADGTVVRDAAQVTVGERLELLLAQGRLQVRAETRET